MAPGRRGRKGKEVVQESEADNVRGLDDIVRGRRGRPARNVEDDQDVDQLTKRVSDMRLMISQFQTLRPPRFFGTEDGEKAASWLKSMKHLFTMLEYTQDIMLKLAICQIKDFYSFSLFTLINPACLVIKYSSGARALTLIG